MIVFAYDYTLGKKSSIYCIAIILSVICIVYHLWKMCSRDKGIKEVDISIADPHVFN